MGTFYQKPPPEGIQAMSLDSPVFHGPAPYTAGGTQIGGVVHATSRPPDHSGPKELGKGGSVVRPGCFSGSSFFDASAIHMESGFDSLYIPNDGRSASEWTREAFSDIFTDNPFGSGTVSLAFPNDTDFGNLYVSSYHSAITLALSSDAHCFNPVIANFNWSAASSNSAWAYYMPDEITPYIDVWYDLDSYIRKCFFLHEFIHAIDARLRYTPECVLAGWSYDNNYAARYYTVWPMPGPREEEYYVSVSEYNAQFLTMLFIGVEPALCDIIARYNALSVCRANNYLRDYGYNSVKPTFSEEELVLYIIGLLFDEYPYIERQAAGLYVANIFTAGGLSLNALAYLESLLKLIYGNEQLIKYVFLHDGKLV